MSAVPDARDARLAGAARALFEELSRVLDAPVAVRLWDGSRAFPGGGGRARAGDREGETRVEIAVNDAGALGSLLRRPGLERLLELYAAGRIEVCGASPLQLVDVLRASGARSFGRGEWRALRKLRLLKDALPLALARGAGAPRAAEVDAHAFAGDERERGAPPERGARLVRFHYDVGNDFYALFLDPEMQYSCAYFTDWKNGLEQAQQDKLEMICRKLRLADGERLLDVGCGWGGLLFHAARRHGAHGLGITLSREQLEYARARAASLGLEGRVTFELADYRALSPQSHGHFDKIASVGMIEHVGIGSLPLYFEHLARLLRDRGLLLNHGITRAAKKSARRFRRLRPEKRLVLRYAFPGHELDHVGHTIEVMESRGFEVRDVEDWREHYAATTRCWSERLWQRRSEAEALAGPVRLRLWLAWLAGVSTAFHDGSLRVYQVLASRHAAKGPSGLPPTRADWYRP